MKTNKKYIRRARLHKKIRSTLHGTSDCPRLSVFRSNKYIYAQLINDDLHVTLASASDIALEDKVTKTERAKKVGTMLGEAGKKASVTKVVFDRGGFAYHGRVQALADAARATGLIF